VILLLASCSERYIIGIEWCFGWARTRKHCISAMGGDIWIILVNGEPGFSRALSVIGRSCVLLFSLFALFFCMVSGYINILQNAVKYGILNESIC